MNFENIMQSELTNLYSNRNSIEDKKVYEMLIHSIKGKFVCEEARRKFVLSRTLSADQIYNPDSSYESAKSFIDCNASMLEKTGNKCLKSYEKIFNCMSGSKKFFSFPKGCVNEMEDFINC